MPSIVQSLLTQLSGPALEKIARQIGVSPAVAQGAIAMALPLLLKALAGNAAQEGGASSLLSALDRNHDGSVLDDSMGFGAAGHESALGGSILGHIFGGNQQAVATGFGQRAGLDPSSSAKLLAILAPLVLGQLGRQNQAKGFDAAGLAGALLREQKTLEQHAPSAMDMISGLLAGAASGSSPSARANQAAAQGPDLLALGTSLLGQFLKR